MRRIGLLLMLGALSASIQAATPITVEQLRQFLSSSHTRKQRDDEIAERQGAVTLSEQLTDRTLAELSAATPVGPQAREQLSLLAAASARSAEGGAAKPSRP